MSFKMHPTEILIMERNPKIETDPISQNYDERMFGGHLTNESLLEAPKNLKHPFRRRRHNCTCLTCHAYPIDSRPKPVALYISWSVQNDTSCNHIELHPTGETSWKHRVLILECFINDRHHDERNMLQRKPNLRGKTFCEHKVTTHTI